MQDATSLAAAIASGQTTARAVMEAALQRAAELEHLGLIGRLEPELGERQVHAYPNIAFHGVPFLGKDLGSGAAGLTPCAGSLALRKRLPEIKEDSELFNRFRASGLVPFGLTTVPEFGLSLTSDPARNPWNENLTPGGSSGGAAGAVAAGIVAMAHATDAAGSIRVPAACCGLVGLKPSRGASVGGPLFGNYLMGIASEFVLARSVRDIATLYDHALWGRGDAAPAEGLFPQHPRIGLAIPDRCGPDQIRAVRAAAEALVVARCTLTVIRSPDALGARASALARLILSVSLAEWLDGLGVDLDEVSPLAAAVASEGRKVPATKLFAASREMMQLSHELSHFMRGQTLILSPVLSGPPPFVGHFDMKTTDVSAHFARMGAMAPNAALANIAGLPALALPFGMAGGMPVGVQLMGPLGSDRHLLRIGARLEKLAPKLTFPYAIAGHP